MSGVVMPPSAITPHCFRDPQHTPLPHCTYFGRQGEARNIEVDHASHTVSPSSAAMTGNNKKRKADDDLSPSPDRMSSSPSPSEINPSSKPLTSLRNPSKRLRTNTVGRPLSLSRLLETLSADQLRTVLSSLCDRTPSIGTEIVSTAPRPSVSSALNVLDRYEADLRHAFPYGDRPGSEYSYNRVRQPLMAVIDALKDYTPQFLPPQETQPATSFAYLHGATELIHRLPDWDTYEQERHKHEAYEEMARAWALVIREAAKRGGGIQVQYGGWDQKLSKHNEASGGKMAEAVQALREALGWIDGGREERNHDSVDNGNQEASSIRQQLMSGTYGVSAIQVGPGW